MNELYCKNCGTFAGKNGKFDEIPDKCPECGMKFYPNRIPKVALYSLVPGGGQIANGNIVVGSLAFGFGVSGLITPLLFGFLIGHPIVGFLIGIFISGTVMAAASNSAFDKSIDMAGLNKHQIASVESGKKPC